MNKIETYYFTSFLNAFLKSPIKQQWMKLIDKEVAPDLSTWDIWEIDNIEVGKCTEWNDGYYLIKNVDMINQHLDSIVLVVQFGHDDYKISYQLLKQIINGEIYILEGLVIINPKIALVFNHDGGILICEDNTDAR